MQQLVVLDPMGVTVTLVPRETRQVGAISKDRFGSVRDVDEDKVEGWTHEPLKRHFIGLLGEFAFAKHYGLTVDTETYLRSDDGDDFLVALDDERTAVDVKTTPHEDGRLLVKQDSVDSDLYVLAVLEDAVPDKGEYVDVRLAGSASRERVLSGSVSELHGHRNHWLDQFDLDQIPDPESITEVSDRAGS
jgi:hypothetical protein